MQRTPRIMFIVMAWLAVGLTATASHAAEQQAAVTLTPMGQVDVNSANVWLSPDGTRIGLETTQGSRRAVRVDGIAGPMFSGLDSTPQIVGAQASNTIFSADSQASAYVGYGGDQRRTVVINNRPGPQYDGIRWIGFSPEGHNLAYIAMGKHGELGDTTDMNAYQIQNAEKMLSKYTVVINGVPGPPYQFINGNAVMFSPDGTRTAYIGRVEPEMQKMTPEQKKQGMVMSPRLDYQIVLDGKPGPFHSGIQHMAFSPQGDSFAYITNSKQNKTRVHVNGKTDPPVDSIRKVGNNQMIVFSPNGKHYAYIAEQSDPEKKLLRQPVFVFNGEKKSAHKHITSVAVSNSGSYAYAAYDVDAGQRMYVYHDGEKSLDYRQIESLFFTPDGKQLIYIANNDGTHYPVINGQEQPGLRSAEASRVTFSPNGSRYAFPAQTDGGRVVFADGEPGPVVDGLDPKSIRFNDDGQLTYKGGNYQGSVYYVEHEPTASGGIVSPDGQRRAGIDLTNRGKSSQQMRLVVDGEPVGPEGYHTISDITFSPDSKRVAAIGRRSGYGKSGYHLILDDQEGPAYAAIEALAFSPDSRHIAYLARRDRDDIALVVDGQEVAGFERTYTGRNHQNGEARAFGFQGDTLRFFASRDGMVYRVEMHADQMDTMPSIAELAAAKSGVRVLHDVANHTRDGGYIDNFVLARDGSMFATAANGGAYGKGYLFRLDENASNMKVLVDFVGNTKIGAKPGPLVLGNDGRVYGVLSRGGEHSGGQVFRVDADGSNFTIIKQWEANTRLHLPRLVTVHEDGWIYGIPGGYDRHSDAASKLIRIDTPTGETQLVYESIDQATWERERNNAAFMIESAKEQHASRNEMFSTRNNAEEQLAKEKQRHEEKMKELNARLAEAEAKLAAEAGRIGPMLDDGKGKFYGLTDKTIYSLTYDGTYKTLHEFTGPPDDAADGSPPQVLHDGWLYGFVKQGPGLMYRIKTDGSGLNFGFEPPADKFNHGEYLLQGPDGRLYGLGSQGLYAINTDGQGYTVIDNFEETKFPGRPNVLAFIGDDLVGFAKRGNGGSQVFRYRFPSDETANMKAQIVETTAKPGELIVPAGFEDVSSQAFGTPVSPPAVKAYDPKTGLASANTDPADDSAQATPKDQANTQPENAASDDPVTDAKSKAEQEQQEAEAKAEEEKKKAEESLDEKIEDGVEDAKKKFKKLFGF